MSASVASSRVDPKFANSPYLQKPIGSVNHDKRSSRRRSGSPSRNAKKSTGQMGRDSDAQSVASLRTNRSVSNRSVSTYRTHKTSYSRPSHQNNASKLASMKSFLLPREMEKLLRGLRQKHSNVKVSQDVGGQDDDDNSTIASDYAESLDDRAVYLHCRKGGEDVMNCLFSSSPFAEIAIRNSDPNKTASRGQPVWTLPPLGSSPSESQAPSVRLDHDSGSVSDLESVHSVVERSSNKQGKGGPGMKHTVSVYSRRKR